MLRVGSLTGRRVLLHKKTTTAKDGTVTDKYQKLGRVHAAVFTPDGKHVAGFTIKRPDVAGMVKRADAFLARDSLKVLDEKTLQETRPEGALDEAALRRLEHDWDRCIMWSGMDAKTTAGKPLGYVSDAEYDEEIEIDLSALSPLAACPHSPDNVKSVDEIGAIKVDQVCIGSCTISFLLDMMKVAHILKGKTVNPDVSLAIAPGSKQVLNMMADMGILGTLIAAGARIQESACGPCIGM